jgi:hypothetical protein
MYIFIANKEGISQKLTVKEQSPASKNVPKSQKLRSISFRVNDMPGNLYMFF